MIMKSEDCWIYTLFMFVTVIFCIHVFFTNTFIYQLCNVTHIEYPTEFPNATYRKDWNLCTFESMNAIPWVKQNFSLWSPCITFFIEDNNTTSPIYDMTDRYGDQNCTLGCDFLFSINSNKSYTGFINWFVKNYSNFLHYPDHIPCIHRGNFYEASQSFFSFTYFKRSVLELFN